MADAMMMFLGEAHGVNWYWAQPGEFENPGVYYWDGVKNVLCVPHLAAAPEAPAQGDPLEKLTRIQEELGLYNDKPAQADMGNPISVPAPWREAVKAPNAIEAAAKMLCARMDYPWDYMPEKGREAMRGNATAILDAAIAQLDALEGGE